MIATISPRAMSSEAIRSGTELAMPAYPTGRNVASGSPGFQTHIPERRAARRRILPKRVQSLVRPRRSPSDARRSKGEGICARNCVPLIALVATLSLAACATTGTDTEAEDDGPAPFASTYTPRPSQPTLIRNATVFDGNGAELANADVLMRDGRIVVRRSES